MKPEEIKKIVDEVADLVAEFFTLQNYSGEYDSLPRKIAYALKHGFIACPRCGGSGMSILPDKECKYCNATGRINFTIPSLQGVQRK